MGQDRSSSSSSTSVESSGLLVFLCSPLVLSFVGGIVSSSLVWWSLGQRSCLDNDKEEDDGDATAATSPSYWNSVRHDIQVSIDDIKSRIGELPGLRRRSHWPWDRKRRRPSRPYIRSASSSINTIDGDLLDGSNNNRQEQDSKTNSPTASSPEDHHHHAALKSDLCIGSIFGMDVGGSLAKLVYFEQKSSTSLRTRDSILGHHNSRERSYRNAASAQAVLMARRGLVRRSSADSSLFSGVYNDNTTAQAGTGTSSDDDDNNVGLDLQSNNNHPLRVMGRPASARAILRRQRSRSEDAGSSARTTTSTDFSAAPRPSSERFLSSTGSSGTHHHHHHHHRHAASAREMKHAYQSNQDLETLNMLRQESVPDDLHVYAETVHPLLHHSQPRGRSLSLSLSMEQQQQQLTSATSNDTNDSTENNGQARGSGEEEGIFWRSSSASPGGGGDDDDDKTAAAVSPDKSTATSTNDDTKQQMRKSRSMFDLSKSRNREQALDHFYNFARRLDSYREGLKDDKLSIYSRELGGEFHFIHFETRRMQQAMDLIRTNNLHLNIHEMGATGGGAHKYAHKWEDELGIEMKKQDELDSLVTGMQFVLSSVVGECYSFRPKTELSPKASFTGSSSDDLSMGDSDIVGAPTLEDDDDGDEAGSSKNGGDKRRARDADDDSPNTNDEDEDDEVRGKGDEWWWSRKVQRDAISHSATFPYLLVTIGTGVSILRVDGPRKYERISGSTIGGGTYWGLIRLLTDLENFEDVMRLAARGDPSKVDMMVGDIYGENSDALEKFGLKASLVASSFGKLVAKEDPAAGLKQEDLARALLLMITNNIGQVAYLNAKLTKTRRIYFVGNFLRQNKISQRRLSFAIDYWSKGEMEALFLEHEGYFGALGAFLLSQDIKPEADAEQGDAVNGESSSERPSSASLQTPQPPRRRSTFAEAWSSSGS